MEEDQAVKIVWRDSYGVSSDWESRESADTNTIQEVTSYGIVIFKDERQLVLASHVTLFFVTGCMTIPIETIESITELK